MPRGQLSKEDRLRIQVTRLTNIGKNLRASLKELRSQLKAREKEIIALKAKLEDKEAQRKHLLTFLYKSRTTKEDAKRPGKKQGAPGFHRPMPPKEDITSSQTFSLTQCPMCHHAVGVAVESVRKYEEDIVMAPRHTVKEFIITRHWCSHCEEFVRSPDIPPISRIGVNVLGYILYARYRLRLPIEKIKESLLDLHDFRISKGEISEKLQEAEALFGKDYESIIELIKQASVVYADETGWRMNGENWWLWAYVTKDGTRFQVEMTRGKGIAEEALGSKRDRVIISDGYAAYQNLPGDKQQCWVHLLRVAKEGSKQLYEEIAVLYQKLGEELTKPLAERKNSLFERELEKIEEKSYEEEQAKKVQERIKRHHKRLLTCLLYEGVLPENNTAERAIRPQVIMRKIFGGCRSPDGARAHAVNTSVLETLRKQNPNATFFDVVMPILQQRLSERHSGL
jgi:transposase